MADDALKETAGQGRAGEPFCSEFQQSASPPVRILILPEI
jgi:hypothetical protein